MLNQNLHLLAQSNQFGGTAHPAPTRTNNWHEVKANLEKKLTAGPIVIDGVLESLSDIRPCLTWIRKQLIAGSEVGLIVGYKDGWHSWGAEQLLDLLAAAGIEAEVSSQTKQGKMRIGLSCSSGSYDAFLERNSLPPASTSHLIISTEHSAYRVTGGIGSYAHEALRLYGPGAAALIVDDNYRVDMEAIRRNKWMACQTFLSPARIDQAESSNFDATCDVVLETLQSLACLYPDLASIECQEMLLYRAIEAKRLGLLDTAAKFITVCHGSSFHLAKANRDVLPAENIHVAYREKLTLEESDCVIFPTVFLKQSYREYGVQTLDDPSRVIKRLPFDYARIPKGSQPGNYKRLLYVGKTSTIKGFDLFLETVDTIYKENPALLQDLDEILVLATSVDIIEPQLKNHFDYLAAVLPMRIASLQRDELLRTYANYAADTLTLVTYRGDNHSLAVLELMAVGMDFLAANAGGTPELIPDAFKDDILVEANTAAFAQTTAALLAKGSARSELVKKLRSAYIAEQESINKDYNLQYLESLPSFKIPDDTNGALPEVLLYVVTKGDAERTKKTTDSVRAQTYPHIKLRQIAEGDELPAEGVTMRLYEGDELRSDAVELMVRALTKSGDRSAVLAYEEVPVYAGGELKGIEEFHPFPPQLGSVFLQEKYQRRFVGLFDGRSGVPEDYSDWQKAIWTASSGLGVTVVPELLVTLAEQDDYPNPDTAEEMSRLITSYRSLPLFDAHILHSELKRLDDIYWGLRLKGHLPQYFVHRDDPTILHGSTPLLRKAVSVYHNATPRAVKAAIRLSYRGATKVRRLLRGRA